MLQIEIEIIAETEEIPKDYETIKKNYILI